MFLIASPREYNILTSFFFPKTNNISKERKEFKRIPSFNNTIKHESPNILIPPNIHLSFQIRPVQYLFDYYAQFFPYVNLTIPLQDNTIRDPEFKTVRFTNYTYTIPKISQYSIISAYFIDKTRNIYTFCKNIRSVSNAYVVLFIDPKTVAKMNVSSSFFRACGTLFINLPYISTETPNYKISDTRYVVFWMFTRHCLELYPDYFKQIMFIDGFDTIFQEDPFDESIPHDTVYIQTEGVKFRQSYINQLWLSRIQSGPPITFYLDKYVVNAGMILGSLEAVERFFQFNLRFILGLMDRDAPFDQNGMAFLFYNNIYSLNNISVVLNHPPNTSYISLTGCNNIVKFSKGPGFVYPNSNKHLKMLHQYNRDKRWENFILSFYPNEPNFLVNDK